MLDGVIAGFETRVAESESVPLSILAHQNLPWFGNTEDNELPKKEPIFFSLESVTP